MPDWMPPPDVRFDHAAAEALADAIRAARLAIADHRDLIDRAHARAAVSWHGRARLAAEDRLDALAGSLARADDDLTALGRSIELAGAWAVDEQDRRDSLQRRWAEERAVESAPADAS